jgi:NADH-quinone oxidoreductase subunit I
MFGTGVLKGLGVVMRHFVGSYIDDLGYLFRGGRYYNEKALVQRQGPKGRGVFTVQYPEEKLPVPENFRYLPFLIYDTAKNDDKCTSCGICAKVCPPQCIWIVRTNDPVTKRPVPQPAEFYIDTTICMQCGFCAEFCPFDAIKMDHDYEIAAFERFQTMIYDKATLTKPDTYHAAIHPADWAREMKEAAEAAVKDAEKKRKAEEAAKAKAAAAAQATAQSGEQKPPVEGTTSS